MTYSFEWQENALIYKGASYPFSKPEEFDTWLKAKQDSFIQGYLHAYTGAPQQGVSNQSVPQQEVFL